MCLCLAEMGSSTLDPYADKHRKASCERGLKVQSYLLVGASRSVHANGLVRDVAGAALHAVVHTDLADRAESFVIKRRHTQSGAHFFVELAQICQLLRKCRKLGTIGGEQKFLVAGVPEPGELPVQHDGGHDGHLEVAVGNLAELRTGAVFFHTHHATRAADGKTESREAVHGFLFKAFVDIPHSNSRVRFLVLGVKGGRGGELVSFRFRVHQALGQTDTPHRSLYFRFESRTFDLIWYRLSVKRLSCFCHTNCSVAVPFVNLVSKYNAIVAL